MFAIRVLAQRRHMWSDPVHQQFSLRRLSHVNHLLDDVIRKLIFHHSIQGTKRNGQRSLTFLTFFKLTNNSSGAKNENHKRDEDLVVPISV